jgi:HAD superfamily hydrolase (TIGR01509 family)
MVKVFDLDGTILDSNGIWRTIDETFLGRHGLKTTDEYNEYVAHAIFPDAAQFTRSYYQLALSEEAIMDSWRELAQQAYAEQLPLKPGVLAYLRQCRSHGERMALYTSCEPSLCQAALAHHELTPYFEEIYYAQALQLEKKYAASFTQLSKLLQEKPEDCILFDDSPVACHAAKQAHWQVIGLQDPFFDHHQAQMRRECDRYLESFLQLLEDSLEN